MLGTPYAGWVNIKVGAESVEASYLTDVPMDLLSAFERVMIERDEPMAVRFDLEGSYAFLLLTGFDSFLIITGDSVTVTQQIVTTDTLARECVDAIRKDMDAWAAWGIYDEEFGEYTEMEIKGRKEVMTIKCDRIDECLRREIK